MEFVACSVSDCVLWATLLRVCTFMSWCERLYPSGHAHMAALYLPWCHVGENWPCHCIAKIESQLTMFSSRNIYATVKAMQYMSGKHWGKEGIFEIWVQILILFFFFCREKNKEQFNNATALKGVVCLHTSKPNKTWMGVCTKKVKVYLKKWCEARRHRWASVLQPGSWWPLGDGLYAEKCSNHGD